MKVRRGAAESREQFPCEVFLSGQSFPDDQKEKKKVKPYATDETEKATAAAAASFRERQLGD